MDPDVLRFYAAGGERERLEQGPFRLERARTEELLGRFLPPPPARVVDVGGGAGAYACPLARRGYQVTLVDPVPLHLEQARHACDAHPEARIARVLEGDARNLSPLDDESADAVLMLGPLYHLPDPGDRRRALAEARRVVRPGGIVMAAGISRFASLLDGIAHRALRDPAFAAIVEKDLATGRHHNPESRREWFTTAYFHRPDELRDEVEATGFREVVVLGIEGPGWIDSGFDARWADETDREALLRAARLVEAEPSLAGASAHLMAVGRRPV